MLTISLKRSQRRTLFNVFAFALLAFAIYLTVFKKEVAEKVMSGASSSASSSSDH